MPNRAARLLFQLPRESRTYAKMTPAAQWGWHEILANKTNYLLELVLWTKTRDAQKKFPRNKPKPYVPEFMGGQVARGSEAHTTAEIDAILKKPRV